MTTMNRLHNCGNPYQDKYKKVLCVCSAGLLRSPTAAYVLSQEPYNFNTRAAGAVADYALFPVDIVHLTWADEIVCMEKAHADVIRPMLKDVLGGSQKKIIVLGIPDKYTYRDPEMVKLIRKAYDDHTIMEKALDNTPKEV